MRSGARTLACRVETLLDACGAVVDCATRPDWARASRRVSTRHARVRAPRLPGLVSRSGSVNRAASVITSVIWVVLIGGLLASSAHAQTLQQAESLWRAHQY